MEMKRYRIGPNCVVFVETGDITQVRVDAIVNAANERMLGGGGVDGAIHRAAGSGLLEACREVAEVRPDVRCPRGEARITAGFDLPADHVIHCVGPVYQSAETSAPVLASAYRSSLELANQYSLKAIAFPAISCGVYGYPVDEAAEVAIRACAEFITSLDSGTIAEIHFVLFSEADCEQWCAVADRLLDSDPHTGPVL
jgi:O-acetyl-ADP-ribose deacetylase (regulator of RNase III)